MTTSLDLTLEHLGYAVRPQQRTLYDALMAADERGVIVQAGTGTGKSLAVLAAAADWVRMHGGSQQQAADRFVDGPVEQVVVVTPTKVLMDQYMAKDARAVEAATGLFITSLKGRRSYVCPASPGMRNPRDEAEMLLAAQYNDAIFTLGHGHPIETPHHRFGCPGKKRHRGDDDDNICQAMNARDKVFSADIVITNLHILIFDDRMKSADNDGLLPDYGLLLVDEAHKVEETLRGFSSTTIAKKKLDKVKPDFRANAMIDMLMAADVPRAQEQIVPASREVIQALADLTLTKADDDDDEPDEEDEPSVSVAARMFLEVGRGGYFDSGSAIMHFVPSGYGSMEPNPKLRLTWIDLAARCNSLLTKTPVGLVSATIPQSLPGALGLGQARMLDVGHPFDYSRQATLTISEHSGAFKVATATFEDRCQELLAAIRRQPGGSLVLFSALRDLKLVHDRLVTTLEAEGRLVLAQRDEADKARLAARFLDPWEDRPKPPVLFGSESFATGFDAPGDTLTLVAVWKLPYPGLSPVTQSIQARNRRRYEDMMRVSVAQAIGRLIRTETDTGEALILDSRGTKLLDRTDPMLSHLLTFGRS